MFDLADDVGINHCLSELPLMLLLHSDVAVTHDHVTMFWPRFA